jgi:hypothetical protein
MELYESGKALSLLLPQNRPVEKTPWASIFLHRADELSAVGIGWNQSRYGLPVFSDHNAFRIEILQKRKALFFEF